MAITGFSYAESLLGNNYIGGAFGIYKFGDDDLDDLLGTAYQVKGVGNINLFQNIDLNLNTSYLWADGDEGAIDVDVSRFTAGAGLVIFFELNEQISPYVRADVALWYTDIEISGFGPSEDDDDTEVGGGGGGGVEIEATDNILFRGGLDYFTIDSEDDYEIYSSLGYWFNERIFGFIRGSYLFDSEDTTGDIGIIIAL
jgi:opacity protein-like surface antigen